MSGDNNSKMPNPWGNPEAFGDGINRSTRRRLRPDWVAAASPAELAQLQNEINRSHGWDSARERYSSWLEIALPATTQCPIEHADKSRADRCCGACDPAKLAAAGRTGEIVCGGPNWREWEDLEWYPSAIYQLLIVVDQMVQTGNAGLAASYAVDLGDLFRRAIFTDQFEKDALAGKAVNEGRSRAGAASRKQPAEDRVSTFNKHRLSGLPIIRSYRAAADELGINWKTVERDVLSHRKKST